MNKRLLNIAAGLCVLGIVALVGLQYYASSRTQNREHLYHIFSEGNRILMSAEHAVRVYDRAGKFQSEFGEKGDEPGEFSGYFEARGAPDGTIWVADMQTLRVLHFSATGELLKWWGGYGHGPQKLVENFHVQPLADGTIWVFDTTGHEIERFTSAGEFIGLFPPADTGANHDIRPSGRSGGLDAEVTFTAHCFPHAMALAPDGNIYVSEHTFGRIFVFSPEGRFLHGFGMVADTAVMPDSWVHNFGSKAGLQFTEGIPVNPNAMLMALPYVPASHGGFLAPLPAPMYIFADGDTLYVKVTDEGEFEMGDVYAIRNEKIVARLKVPDELAPFDPWMVSKAGNYLLVTDVDQTKFQAFDLAGNPVDAFQDADLGRDVTALQKKYEFLGWVKGKIPYCIGAILLIAVVLVFLEKRVSRTGERLISPPMVVAESAVAASGVTVAPVVALPATTGMLWRKAAIWALVRGLGCFVLLVVVIMLLAPQAMLKFDAWGMPLLLLLFAVLTTVRKAQLEKHPELVNPAVATVIGRAGTPPAAKTALPAPVCGKLVGLTAAAAATWPLWGMISIVLMTAMGLFMMPFRMLTGFGMGVFWMSDGLQIFGFALVVYLAYKRSLPFIMRHFSLSPRPAHWPMVNVRRRNFLAVLVALLGAIGFAFVPIIARWLLMDVPADSALRTMRLMASYILWGQMPVAAGIFCVLFLLVLGSFRCLDAWRAQRAGEVVAREEFLLPVLLWLALLAGCWLSMHATSRSTMLSSMLLSFAGWLWGAALLVTRRWRPVYPVIIACLAIAGLVFLSGLNTEDYYMMMGFYLLTSLLNVLLPGLLVVMAGALLVRLAARPGLLRLGLVTVVAVTTVGSLALTVMRVQAMPGRENQRHYYGGDIEYMSQPITLSGHVTTAEGVSPTAVKISVFRVEPAQRGNVAGTSEAVSVAAGTPTATANPAADGTFSIELTADPRERETVIEFSAVGLVSRRLGITMGSSETAVSLNVGLPSPSAWAETTVVALDYAPSWRRPELWQLLETMPERERDSVLALELRLRAVAEKCAWLQKGAYASRREYDDMRADVARELVELRRRWPSPPPPRLAELDRAMAGLAVRP